MFIVNRGKYKKILRPLLLVLFLVFISGILIVPSLYSTKLTSFSFSFIGTNILVGIISLFMIIRETNINPYSLHLVHWFFQFSFFFIAPAVQYFENRFPWGFLTSTNSELLVKTNIIILIWQFFWAIQTLLVNNNYRSSEMKNDKQVFVSYKKIFIVSILSLLVTLYFVYLYGFSGLFTRGSDIENSINNSSLMLVVLVTLRSIPVILLTLIIIKMKTNRGFIIKLLFILSSIMLLITNFPSATPRYWAAAVYLGLFITFFRIKSKNLIVILLTLGLNVIFPLLAGARRVDNLGDFLNNITISFGNNITSGDYDAFSSISHTIFYIEHFGSTLGNQLLTVLLFFVPRSIWPNKSLGSGYVVAETIGLPFKNVSSALPAEGLINFGIIGVIFFSLLISRLCSYLDSIYWLGNKSSIKIAYPFWIGFFFFIMRGDLLSSTAYLFGFTICFFIFKPLTRHNIVIPKNKSSISDI